ncbi:MAG TPA: helix-turn-helix domain-containing protein [Thermomicrobiales bacterium]|nr:helix-turn-helix domain-containing protein [Thermomicrobiales bacterium]
MGERPGELAALVRAARGRRGWSRVALAARAGVDEDTIRQLEGDRTGHPTYRTLLRLAGALGLSVEHLEAAAARDAAGMEGRDG